MTHKGDDFCGIFAFYNTSIISAAILDVFQIFQALINSYLTDFEVGICLSFASSVVHLVGEWINPLDNVHSTHLVLGYGAP